VSQPLDNSGNPSDTKYIEVSQPLDNSGNPSDTKFSK
jgi:hypothetical protein